MYGAILGTVVSLATAFLPVSGRLLPTPSDAGMRAYLRLVPGSTAQHLPPRLDRVSIVRRLFSRPVRPFVATRRIDSLPLAMRYKTIRRIDFLTAGTTPSNDYADGIATDLNNLGQITYYGNYSESNIIPGYVIDDDGTHRQLSMSLFAPFASCPNLIADVTPTALNDVGGVAGFFGYSVSCGQGFNYSSNLEWLLTGTDYNVSFFDGYVDGAQAVAINDSNVSAGYSQDDPKYPIYQALTFSSQEHRHLLLDLYRAPCSTAVVPGSLHSEASGINDAGQVSGNEEVSCSGLAIGTYKAVRFSTHGYAIQLFPPSSNDFVSAGEAINAAGDIVGYSGYNSLGGFKGFLYRSSCRCVTTIASPAGEEYGDTTALAINASDEVVGFVDDSATNSSTAFLYKSGVTYDLNALLPPNSGWSLLTATAINDSGEIIGEGQYTDPATGVTAVGDYAMKP